MMLAAVLTGLLLLLYTGGAFDSFAFPNTLPWILGLLVLMGFTTWFSISRGRENLVNPLVVATFTYFGPAFVVGGFCLAFGWSQPYFLAFLQDPERDLPFTFYLITLGYAGLAIGYLLPLGRQLSLPLQRILPIEESEPGSFFVPGSVLLAIGLLSSLYAYFVGVLGFQKADEIGIFDGTIYLATLFLPQGSFILWSIVFRTAKWHAREYLTAFFLISTIIGNGLLAGSRGSLLASLILVAFAYLLAGKILSLKRAVGGGILLVLVVIVGMIYGTTFRATKETESRTDFGTYTSYVSSTLDKITGQDNLAILEMGLTSLAQRLDTASSLAVVVSNYEEYAPYEASYGLDDNIWKDISSFLIPRALWPDKPVASDARAYSSLYFDYPDNSFAITPIGDLLRNYGTIGVFIGMLLLGILLRIVFCALLEGKPKTIMRSALYFMIMLPVSFEGFYGTILTMMVKVGATAVVGLLFVYYLNVQNVQRTFRIE